MLTIAARGLFSILFFNLQAQSKKELKTHNSELTEEIKVLKKTNLDLSTLAEQLQLVLEDKSRDFKSIQDNFENTKKININLQENNFILSKIIDSLNNVISEKDSSISLLKSNNIYQKIDSLSNVILKLYSQERSLDSLMEYRFFINQTELEHLEEKGLLNRFKCGNFMQCYEFPKNGYALIFSIGEDKNKVYYIGKHRY